MKLFRRYRQLNKTIEGYGYEYSPKKLIISSLLVVIACLIMGYYYRLNVLSITCLSIYVLLLFPNIITAQFKMMANNASFEQLSNYMDNMIISFKRNPKILNAMEETFPMVSGRMKRCLGDAIETIRNDNSEEVYYKAFALIEDEFQTSRLRTLHRFMLNVERENSVSYQNNIDTLYYDIHSWVTRIYAFQGRLKQSKMNITISIAVSMVIIAYFCQTISSVGKSIKGLSMTDGRFYQAETLIFLMVIIGLYVMVNSKLNGIWLIEDIKAGMDASIIGIINTIEDYDEAAGRKRSIKHAIPLLAISAGGLILKRRAVVLVGLVMFIIMATNSTRMQNSRRHKVKKELLKEFPAWLRDVSVNLHNMVSVNAIMYSYSSSPYVIRPFIDNFISNIEEDPVSIRPYDDFFGEYSLPELSGSIKTLYSIQAQSAEEAQRQVNDLTERNQELIARSEELRLKDTTASITFLAAVPMLAMTGKLMCDMVIVLTQVLTAL